MFLPFHTETHGRALFDPFCGDIRALAVCLEGELGVSYFQKVVALGLGKNFESRLAGCLSEELIAFTRDRQDEVGLQWARSHSAGTSSLVTVVKSSGATAATAMWL